MESLEDLEAQMEALRDKLLLADDARIIDTINEEINQLIEQIRLAKLDASDYPDFIEHN